MGAKTVKMSKETIHISGLSFAPVYAALHERCFERGWSEAEFGTILSDPKCQAFLRLSDDASGNLPSGFIVFRTILNEAEILTIGVVPECRKKGYAQDLLRCAIDELVGSKVDELFLEVVENNYSAKALYQGFGFKTVGTRKNYAQTSTGWLDADIMRLELQSSEIEEEAVCD